MARQHAGLYDPQVGLAVQFVQQLLFGRGVVADILFERVHYCLQNPYLLNLYDASIRSGVSALSASRHSRVNSRYPVPFAVTTLPSRTACRVRGIQVHGDTQQALPGQRVALNLVGDGVAALDRGEVLGVEGRFGQTLRFMMTFTYLGREGAKPRVLESGARVHVMAGTAEVVGRIMFMEGEAPMAVGETRTVQVRLEEPLPLRAGDHAVVLSYSPVMLIGGGRVLLSRCRRSRELSAGELAALETGDAVAGVDAWLALQTLPVVVADVAAALDLVSGEADAALNELVARGIVRELAGPGGTLYANAAVLDAAMDVLTATLSAMHAAAPKETGFTPGAVTHAAWPTADDTVAAALISEGCSRGVCASEGAEVFDPHSAAAAARVVREACERIVALLDEAGLDAPTLPEVGEQLQLDRDTMTRALRELSLNRSIVKIERDVALSAAAEAHARELVAAAIEAAGGAATTSALREALGVSRKRAISILEHLDAVRFTVLDKEAGGLRSLR